MVKRFFLIGFGISITSKNVFKPKNWIPMLFAIKSSFNCPALAQWSLPRNGRLVTNDVSSGTSQSFMFLFRLLDDRIALPTSICLFFVEKIPHHYWNNSYLIYKDFMIPDMTSWPIQKPRLLFFTDSRSSLLGVALAWTLKLDLRALKSQNPIYFLRIPFYTL